jgi:uncharacterized protein (DUF427 family)
VIQRERTDNKLVLKAAGCCYEICRIRPGSLYMAITGSETGQLGRAPLGEVAAEAAHNPPLRLFIDMTRLTGISPEVSDDWTAWFKANRQSIAKVHALVGSPLVQLTVTVSQLISRTGDLIRVHTDRPAFEDVLAQASASAGQVMRAIWRNTVLAESADTIVVEGNHYFPPESLRREFFQDSAHHTTCPWKGEASYYDIVVGSEVNKDAAWYYPQAKPAAKNIEGRVAFWHGVRVE